MGGNSVMFDTGSAFTKKRKRMKGTDGTKKVEIKQWNPRQNNEGDNYNAFNIINIVNPVYHSVALSSSWLPLRLFPPSVGTAPNQRIGKSFFLKYLRFKGYLRVYNRCVVGCRWRIRLLRTDNFNFGDPSGSDQAAKDVITQYVQLGRNNTVPEQWTVGNVTDAFRHNFYKVVSNVDNRNVIKSKIIASGYVPVSAPSTTTGYTGTLTGNAAGVITMIGHTRGTPLSLGYYNVPLDIKVKCNDYFNTEDIKYYIVLEVDQGSGIEFQTNEDVTYSMVASTALTEFNFFVRGYFTDL